MTTVDARNDLLEEAPRFVLWKSTICADVVEQLASGNVFHHEKKISRRRMHLIHFDDVWMPENAFLVV